MTEREGPVPGPEWERGWEGHDRGQRRRIARLPLTEKLRWLEEAQRVLTRMRGSGKGSPEPPKE